jgi:hypothetical protein
MRRHALRQGLVNVELAASLQDDDAGLWFLGCRLAHRAADYAFARLALDKALERGYPRALAVPEMAELAFSMRDFERLRCLQSELPDERRVPQLGPVARYWRKRHD